MFKSGAVDFIVFNTVKELSKVIYFLLPKIDYSRSQVMTLREFNNLPLDGLYDMHADILLLRQLEIFGIKTLLDADAHFVKSRIFTKETNTLTEIDCICAEEFFPLKENLFRRVYKKFSDCAFIHYDAVLINEKSPTDFDNDFSMFENSADLVITFTRDNSALFNHIRKTLVRFEKVKVLKSPTGIWCFCYRRKPPEDFAMYVVTHKKLSAEHVSGFPEGYKVIHAGRVLGEDCGYIGDDTNDNISCLNLYLNELTAVYWMWKNTSHTIIGHCSYRRFFTLSEEKYFGAIDDTKFSYEKILTKDEALKLIADCDVVVTRLACQNYPQLEEIALLIGEELAQLAATSMKKYLLRTHPDYGDAFDYVMNSPSYYQCHMFIMRRGLFNDYCKWLFSFILDATEEALRKEDFQNLSTYEQRAVSFFCERMFTVWLIKNRLRIKEINKMFLMENVDG